MDKILAELIENEVEAEGRLDYSDTEFEYAINADTLNKAKQAKESYLNYKKAEAEYNSALDYRDRYFKIKSLTESTRGIH